MHNCPQATATAGTRRVGFRIWRRRAKRTHARQPQNPQQDSILSGGGRTTPASKSKRQPKAVHVKHQCLCTSSWIFGKAQHSAAMLSNTAPLQQHTHLRCRVGRGGRDGMLCTQCGATGAQQTYHIEKPCLLGGCPEQKATLAGRVRKETPMATPSCPITSWSDGCVKGTREHTQAVLAALKWSQGVWTVPAESQVWMVGGPGICIP